MSYPAKPLTCAASTEEVTAKSPFRVHGILLLPGPSSSCTYTCDKYSILCILREKDVYIRTVHTLLFRKLYDDSVGFYIYFDYI